MTGDLIRLLSMFFAPMGGEENSTSQSENDFVDSQMFLSGLLIGILSCVGLFIYIKQRGSRWGNILRFILKIAR
ncbi:hypothetical protein [Bacillus taeanensis]|uniref:Uncharacterized protein n=1 Tax=Bacillus taeanensis TaxID=273032 RepID=A0A366XNS5_9BACI|nr:hypothetical protein [Bacillus taeanensis]RBW68010.1 hypothetical protein DS031_18915 [Bacillus taeanensis]